MRKVLLRKIKLSDKKYFTKWWRDKELLKLTSGVLKRISNQEVEKYFSSIFHNKKNHHFIIELNRNIIGHISLIKRKNGWRETQIIIGEKKYWGKNYGAIAIQLLIKKAKKLGILKIYLEVRPNNIRAIKAYEKCGFEKSGIKQYFENRNLSETIRMELKIASLYHESNDYLSFKN